MSHPADIQSLLNASPSPAVARQLVEWANSTRERIARGDMTIGILTPAEAASIPVAYRAAAQQGDAAAWIMLAWWNVNPDFGEPDLEAAEQALRAGIDAGVSAAGLELVKLRWFFERDTATPSERNEAYQLVSAIVQADPGNAEGLYLLALLTTYGFGVAASPREGFLLQQKAAELGHAAALFELYVHYANGLGVAADEAAALDACRRAAEAGHPRGMYNLGAAYASGQGLPKSVPEALRWYERAADAGNPWALVGLAVIYATGDGVEPDREYAAQLLDEAEYLGMEVSDVREQIDL